MCVRSVHRLVQPPVQDLNCTALHCWQLHILSYFGGVYRMCVYPLLVVQHATYAASCCFHMHVLPCRHLTPLDASSSTQSYSMLPAAQAPSSCVSISALREGHDCMVVHRLPPLSACVWWAAVFGGQLCCKLLLLTHTSYTACCCVCLPHQPVP